MPLDQRGNSAITEEARSSLSSNLGIPKSPTNIMWDEYRWNHIQYIEDSCICFLTTLLFVRNMLEHWMALYDSFALAFQEKWFQERRQELKKCRNGRKFHHFKDLSPMRNGPQLSWNPTIYIVILKVLNGVGLHISSLTVTCHNADKAFLWYKNHKNQHDNNIHGVV